MSTDEKLPPDATRAHLIEAVNEIKGTISKVEKDVGQLLVIFQTIRGGVTFFIGTVNVLKWCVGAAATISGTYALIHLLKTGKLPPLP